VDTEESEEEVICGIEEVVGEVLKGLAGHREAKILDS